MDLTEEMGEQELTYILSGLHHHFFLIGHLHKKECVFLQSEKDGRGSFDLPGNMKVLPRHPVGDIEEVTGTPHHVEQDLLDVLTLVVELVSLSLQQVLDPVTEGPHDGGARLHVSPIEHLHPGEVGQRSRDHVLQVAILHLCLQTGHGQSLAVAEVRLCQGPEHRAVLVFGQTTGPPGQPRGARGAGLDGRVTGCSPVPGQGARGGGRAVERLVLYRNVHDGDVDTSGGLRQRVVGHPVRCLD